MGLFTLCICITQGEIRVSLPCAAELRACVAAVCVQAGVVGGDGGIVCPRPDAFRIDVSSPAGPLSSSLREEIENGERHRGLIDPASPIQLFVRKRERGEEERERAREKGEGNRGAPIK